MAPSIPVVSHPSPNHGPRPDGVPVDILLVHYTGMPTGGASAGAAVRSGGAGQRPLPDRGGRHRLLAGRRGPPRVACGRRLLARGARHQQPVGRRRTGQSWARMGLPAVSRRPDGLIRRSGPWVMERHGILPHRVLAHSDVAPSRKEDPGELFDWRWLAARGIGFWPVPSALDDGPGHAVAEAQALLARFGYEVEPTGVLNPQTRVAATAFQRHFIPERCGYGLDAVFMTDSQGGSQADRTPLR